MGSTTNSKVTKQDSEDVPKTRSFYEETWDSYKNNPDF